MALEEDTLDMAALMIAYNRRKRFEREELAKEIANKVGIMLGGKPKTGTNTKAGGGVRKVHPNAMLGMLSSPL